MKLISFVFFVVILPLFILLRFVVRKKKRIPLKAIDEAQDGELVRVVGEIQFLDEHLIAPLTGRACVAYEVIVDRLPSGLSVGAVKNGLLLSSPNSREIIKKERRYCNFLLRNGNELAMIEDVSTTNFKFLQDFKTDTDFSKDPDIGLASFLKRKKINQDNFWGFTRNLRGVEGVFFENEIITIQGVGNWEWADDHGLNLPGVKVLIIRNGPKFGVVASNQSGDLLE